MKVFTPTSVIQVWRVTYFFSFKINQIKYHRLNIPVSAVTVDSRLEDDVQETVDTTKQIKTSISLL